MMVKSTIGLLLLLLSLSACYGFEYQQYVGWPLHLLASALVCLTSTYSYLATSIHLTEMVPSTLSKKSMQEMLL